MQFSRSLGLARGVMVALSLCLVAGSAFAEAVAWDQKGVTQIAVELAKELRGLHVAVRRNPRVPATTLQRRAQYQAREDVRFLVNVSQRLASQLQAGEDKDATLPTFRRLQMFRRDAEQSARSLDIQKPILERVENARALVDQLAPFYEEAPGTPGTEAPAPAPAPAQ